MKKSILASALSLVTVLSCIALPVGAGNEVSIAESNVELIEGNWGDELIYVFDGIDTLTIRGTVGMDNYSSYNSQPWNHIRSQIKNVIIEDGVTSIGAEAFSSLGNLISVTIPDSVTSIGYNAFAYCVSLASIEIPDSVTSVGADAFSYTGMYTSGESWENSVLYIDDYLVKADTSIVGDYKIKDGTKSILSNAFNGCDTLTGVTIPDSVTSIGSSAFEYCESLASVIISDSVKSIGYNAFSDTALYRDSENWEDGVLYVGNHLIKADTSISGDYEIKDGTKSIADDAFYGCNGLTGVTIPDSVKGIGDVAFGSCGNLASVEMGSGVTSIGTEAFAYCEKLTSITIPGGVKSLGSRILGDCGSLTDITILDGITSIDERAFEDCSGIASITIPNSVKSIGDMAFSGCENLTSVEIGNGVTSIGYNAFYGCGLSGITIPDSVKSIGDMAFCGCEALAGVEMGSGVTSIGYGAFSDTALYNESENWVEGVLYIGNHLIKAEDNISGDYEIKDGTKIIADEAFSNCSSLTDITIPDSVTDIGEGAFRLCDGITGIVIPVGVTSVKERTFESCSSLKGITIPDSVTDIGDYAFENCYFLEHVTIPDSVKSIGNFAFSGCNFTSIIIGKNVKSIGFFAFRYCSNLQDIYYTGTEIDGNYILIDAGNDCLFDAVIYYNFKPGVISWTFDEGTLTIRGSGAIPDKLFESDEVIDINNIIIEQGITKIGESLFSDCYNLKSVTIPESVKRIDYYAFENCSQLETVYYMGTGVDWNEILMEAGNEYLYNATINYNYKPYTLTWTPGTNKTNVATDFAGTYDVIFFDTDGEIVPVEVTFDKKGEQEVKLPDEVSETGFKIFLWESFETMRPLADALEIN